MSYEQNEAWLILCDQTAAGAFSFPKWLWSCRQFARSTYVKICVRFLNASFTVSKAKVTQTQLWECVCVCVYLGDKKQSDITCLWAFDYSGMHVCEKWYAIDMCLFIGKECRWKFFVAQHEVLRFLKKKKKKNLDMQTVNRAPFRSRST